GAGAKPQQLQGFQLATDQQDLWAVSGAVSAPAEITILRMGVNGFQQLDLSDPSGAFREGDGVGGIAAEPHSGAVWIGFRHSDDPEGGARARLALVHSDGSVDAPVTLPPEGEGVGGKGSAGPIECSGPEQCWMASNTGWLFHLGPDPSPDSDPAMH